MSELAALPTDVFKNIEELVKNLPQQLQQFMKEFQEKMGTMVQQVADTSTGYGHTAKQVTQETATSIKNAAKPITFPPKPGNN